MRNLLLLLIPLYLGYHLFTLDRQHLPTYDEAILAKSVQDISKEGVSFFNSPDFDKKTANATYFSPLFACLNVPVIHYLGFSLYNLRLIGVIFSAFILLLLFSYFGEFEKGSFKNASILFIIAFMMDPVLNLHLHANGEIVVALFFLLISLKTEFYKKEHSFSSTIFSGIWFVIAILFYMPLIFVVPFLVLHKVLSSFSGTSEEKSYHVSHLLFWIATVGLLFSFWLLFANLNLADLIQKSFLASSRNSPQHVFYVYILPSIASVGILIYSLFQRKYTIENKFTIFLTIGIAVSFMICNGIFQENYLVLLPFLYLAFFGLLPLNITDNFARMGRYIPIICILTINIVLFSFQFIETLFNYSSSKSTELNAFIVKYIPKEATVLGDATSSISLISQGYQFQAIKNSLDLNEKLKTTKATYAIIGQDFEITNGYTGSTLEYNGFRKIAKIEYFGSGVSDFLSSIGFVPDNEDHLYSAQIYVRKP